VIHRTRHTVSIDLTHVHDGFPSPPHLISSVTSTHLHTLTLIWSTHLHTHAVTPISRCRRPSYPDWRRPRQPKTLRWSILLYRPTTRQWGAPPLRVCWPRRGRRKIPSRDSRTRRRLTYTVAWGEGGALRDWNDGAHDGPGSGFICLVVVVVVVVEGVRPPMWPVSPPSETYRCLLSIENGQHYS
jgi:hypothetical protein